MPNQRVPSWFFFLCAGEGLLALAGLFAGPSEGGVLSPVRLALIAIVFALILGWLYLGLRAWRVQRGLDLMSGRAVTGIAVLLALTFGLALFLLRYLDPERFLQYYARLSPLLWYLFLLSLQITLLSLVLRNGFHPGALRGNNGQYTAFLISFGILLAVLVFVALTKLGITKDAVYWGEPGVPIPAWLFAAAIVLGSGFLYYESKSSQTGQVGALNVLLPLMIWLVAAGLWLLAPVSTLKNSFYAPITAPYSTPFPYSDAGYYDYLAQSLLVGTDYLGEIPARPLYVSFLALLHFLFGQNFVRIIAAQTIVLALFPVALYWLGARLHSRSAGVMIAFFAIFRELASLWVSSDTRTSVTKMFLTDLPTALFIALICLLTMRWLERRDENSAFVTGGAFGLLLLLRTQVLVVLPFLFLLAWFVYQGHRGFKKWLRDCIILSAMLVLTITPWMLRNYLTIGRFALDYLSPTSLIFSQYTGELDLVTQQVAGSQLLNLILKYPGMVGGFVVNHFLNTQIGSLLALPLIARFDGLFEPINLYWMEWDGSLDWYNLLLVIFYLAVIALGISAAWRRGRWIGLTPLVFSLGYALSNGIARFSSWRYNLPADWVGYFYFGIGVVEIFSQAARLFGGTTLEVSAAGTYNLKQAARRPTHLFFASAFVLVGAFPWMAEGFVAPRYTDQSVSTLEQKLVTISNIPPQAEVQVFLSQPDSFFEMGRILYPRFFTRGKGLASANPWPAYRSQDHPRFGFVLLNDEVTSAQFPSRDVTLILPHAADAILLGCQRADYVEVRLIAFPELNIFHLSAPLTEPCGP